MLRINDHGELIYTIGSGRHAFEEFVCFAPTAATAPAFAPEVVGLTEIEEWSDEALERLWRAIWE